MHDTIYHTVWMVYFLPEKHCTIYSCIHWSEGASIWPWKKLIVRFLQPLEG